MTEPPSWKSDKEKKSILVFQMVGVHLKSITYETAGNFYLLGFSARQGLENSGVICSLNRKCVIVRSQVNFKSFEWRVRSRNLFYFYRILFLPGRG